MNHLQILQLSTPGNNSKCGGHRMLVELNQIGQDVWPGPVKGEESRGGRGIARGQELPSKRKGQQSQSGKDTPTCSAKACGTPEGSPKGVRSQGYPPAWWPLGRMRGSMPAGSAQSETSKSRRSLGFYAPRLSSPRTPEAGCAGWAGPGSISAGCTPSP